jgi:hypothetical protein
MPPDSDRYRREKDLPQTTDIPGYPDDSEGASAADTNRYRREKDVPQTPDIPGYPDDSGGAAAADSDRYPLFKDSGFESIDDYLDYIEERERERAGLPPLFPDHLKPVGPHDGHGSRQVGLRLPEIDFRRLCELGDEYGVAPATLARMIVVRAVRSINLDRPD